MPRDATLERGAGSSSTLSKSLENNAFLIDTGAFFCLWRGEGSLIKQVNVLQVCSNIEALAVGGRG